MNDWKTIWRSIWPPSVEDMLRDKTLFIMVAVIGLGWKILIFFCVTTAVIRFL